jgi:tetratricopeptide (TPR) repeat protein
MTWSPLRSEIIFATLAVFCFAALGRAQSPSKAPSSTGSADRDAATTPPGNEACGKCHRAIFQTYSATPMAHASGPATQDFLPGGFHHAASGVHYRVFLEKGDAWLSFDRDGDPPLHGKRKLEYFIGSGLRGKTYIFSDDGFSFELPVNFYSQRSDAPGGGWDMAPKHQGAKEMPLNSPALPSCLTCHTSDAQAPQVGTENEYASPLFAHGGITCERCHGADTSHGAGKSANTATAGAAASRSTSTLPAKIINPAKLPPARRDAICMQCHLEGNTSVQQPGRHFYEFRAGEDLSDFVRYYVYTGGGNDNVRAVSQFEALAQSKCKRLTGDSMTCISCHNPHASPPAGQRVSYFRAKCLACHGEAFAAKHHVEQPDCASCHMQRLRALDVAHTQATDHRILRLPIPQTASDPSSESALAQANIRRFPPVPVDSLRDPALAWSSLAGAGSQFALAQAEKLLPEALTQNPDDPELLTALGYSEQLRGLTDLAREHYEHALRITPLALEAAANLALIEASAGNLDRAAALWKSTFARDPGRSTWGIDLARALCLSAHGVEAKAVLARVLEFNPDFSTARGMMRQLESGDVKCAPD